MIVARLTLTLTVLSLVPARVDARRGFYHALEASQPSCKDVGGEESTVMLPSFAKNTTPQEFERMKQMQTRNLRREISTLRDQLLSNTLSGVACVHMARLTPNKKVFQWALTSFFESMNVSVMLNNDSSYRDKPNPDLMKQCQLNFIWAQKGEGFRLALQKTPFPHDIIVEQPWIWRKDPVEKERTWFFLGWDYLNGYALTWGVQSMDRWNRYFADHVNVKPWIGPRPNGTVLILGQVPNDISLLGAKAKYGSVEATYTHIVDSVRQYNQDIEIVFRPHPLAFHHSLPCIVRNPDGSTLQDAMKTPLSNAISEAAVVISISSTASIQAALNGVPVIALDPLSPAWPVACHDFSAFDETIMGSGCRPSRDQWLANIAYMTWNADDIASGEAIKFLLDY